MITGIDLGTTYSAIAQFDTHGRPVIMTDSQEENLVPSCVAYFDDQWWVGREAIRQWIAGPTNAAARFKRFMGTSERFNIGGDTFTPTQLSAHVLRHMHQIALNHQGEVGTTVVTIPANFSVEARQETINAAKHAGLKMDYIINEPTAAALYYAFSGDLVGDGKYAVYDFGGGTFDISLIELNSSQVDVITSNGVSRLGGMDFDKILQKIVRQKYEEATQSTLDEHELEETPFDLVSIEELKRSLSRRETVTQFAKGTVLEITRQEFEEAISGLVMQAEVCCGATLKEAKISSSELSGVILAGGSTRVPCIRKSIQDVFKDVPLIESANVDEVVALGAVLYAAIRADSNEFNAAQSATIAPLQLTEVTNMNFGTIVLDYDEIDLPFLNNSIIIRKGTPIPCSQQQTYYTRYDGQDEVDCSITECAREETEMNEFIKIISDESKLKLPKLPKGEFWPAHEEIIVTFSYDENQIMHCSFLHENSGHSQEVDLDFNQVTDDTKDYKISGSTSQEME
ncbi:MAG: Hsp70 family protein [Bacteroidetes bacterium]|nr:Hsp70 family protein [Bacteroidota bacterium]MCY4233225.1 Hsp70 family protein [Bacteroidota bacterium]